MIPTDFNHPAYAAIDGTEISLREAEKMMERMLCQVERHLDLFEDSGEIGVILTLHQHFI